ncbi:MAG: hypothetical protein KDC11_04905, partial [Chitinophagaceae bacterium]|nr:hypothetical protein [Chitinophagaceae bacterium]
TAPGFVLLDKAPALVEKPSDPKAFGVDILNLFEGGAIQTTPYWFFNHPNYTFDKHINNQFPILQTFNLSVATTNADTFSSLAAGGRVTVVRLFSERRKGQIDSIKKDIINLLVDMPIDEKAIAKKKAELEYLKSRTSFSAEIAGAIAISANNNTFDNLDVNKSGMWLNLRWTPNYKLPIDVCGVARYTWANTSINTDSTFFDYGISASYSSKELDISLEYVSRNDYSTNQSYTRFALVSNYMVSKNIVVVASIGKDFSQVENILGVFGVKLAFSNEKMQL